MKRAQDELEYDEYVRQNFSPAARPRTTVPLMQVLVNCFRSLFAPSPVRRHPAVSLPLFLGRWGRAAAIR